MKATVEKVLPVRRGDDVLLTLRFASQAPRTQTYRVSAQAYTEAGSPCEGEELTGDVLIALTLAEDTRLAYARAAKILAAGDNTRAALLRKLKERGFSAPAAEAAVERLSAEGYLPEEEMLLRQLAIYAKRLWGPKRFLPALLAKGFSRDAIRTALLRAEAEGIYDSDAIKERLLADLGDDDPAARRAWLYKHGF